MNSVSVINTPIFPLQSTKMHDSYTNVPRCTHKQKPEQEKKTSHLNLFCVLTALSSVVFATDGVVQFYRNLGIFFLNFSFALVFLDLFFFLFNFLNTERMGIGTL